MSGILSSLSVLH
ncbi:UNVERIFIED_CONTAM: hypothetical protein NCL1_57981 [Trichonephila clavipes]